MRKHNWTLRNFIRWQKSEGEYTYAAHEYRILFFLSNCAKFEPAHAPACRNHHPSTCFDERVEKWQFAPANACANWNFATMIGNSKLWHWCGRDYLPHGTFFARVRKVECDKNHLTHEFNTVFYIMIAWKSCQSSDI